MKFSAVFVTGLAAAASAAPTDVSVRNVDISGLNNLNGFKNTDLNYLLSLNAIDLNLFNQLGQVQNLQLGGFQHLFNVQVFDVQALLQLQQLSTVVVLQQQGLFNGVDLVNVQLGGLDLGVIQNIRRVDLQQFVRQDAQPRIQEVAQGHSEFVVTSKE